MANPEHLALLKKGVEAWNNWRKENSWVEIDLSKSNLSGENLSGAYLRKVDFNNANLIGAKLLEADLSGAMLANASFQGADIREAKFIKTDLSFANFSNSDLRKAKLRGSHLVQTRFLFTDLRESNFSESWILMTYMTSVKLKRAIFRNTTFLDCDLSSSDLSEADFRMAKFIRSKALDANFRAAKFTGLCLQDWHINSTTNLDNIDCKYIYWKYPSQERRPSSGNFAPEEFSKWIQKASNTLDLILQSPDWEAFAYSFRRIQVENEGEDLAIQSIENKGDGTVIVRVSVSPTADKEDLHSSFIQGYEFACKALKPQYEARLRDKEQAINRLIYLISQEKELQKLMAENSSRNINTGGGNYIESNSGTYVEGDYINMSQNLTQAASSIEDLVNQRVQKQEVTVDVAQQQVANDLATQAQENPTVMGKLVKWGQSLANDAAKATVGDVAKGTVKLALRAAGLPLP